METPCQKNVWEVIPAIKAAIVVELVSFGISQVEIAKKLGIAPSAVSQYISGKRGYRIEFEDDVKRFIKRLADDIGDGKDIDLTPRFCEICRLIQDNNGQCGKGSV